MKKLLLFPILLLLASSAFSINKIVPTTDSTIQAALNTCQPGDTIFVMPGTYRENIIWPDKYGIKLISLGDSSNTIIDGDGKGIVLSFVKNYSSTAVIDSNTLIKGFKITNGFKTGSSAGGSGIYLYERSPQFTDIQVINNKIIAQSWANGAGVSMRKSNSIFSNSLIAYNKIDSSQWGFGGGVHIDESAPRFYNVKIIGNQIKSSSWNHGAGVYCDNSTPIMINVEISNNKCIHGSTWYYGAGLYLSSSDMDMINGLITGNVFETTSGSFFKGCGIYIDNYSTDTNQINIINTTVANNRRTPSNSVIGLGLNCVDFSGGAIKVVNSIFYNPNQISEISANSFFSITHSSITAGFVGIGNVDVNPLFVSTNNYRLSSISPCINQGDSSVAPLFDIENHTRLFSVVSFPDLGCYEFYDNTGFSEADNKLMVKNYPNPFSDYTTIQWFDETSSMVQIEILDLLGRVIYQSEFNSAETENKITINTSAFAAGTYLCRFSTQNKSKTLKLVKY